MLVPKTMQRLSGPRVSVGSSAAILMGVSRLVTSNFCSRHAAPPVVSKSQEDEETSPTTVAILDEAVEDRRSTTVSASARRWSANHVIEPETGTHRPLLR